MRKLLLLLWGVVFFAAQAIAQRSITGKVTDEKGNPLPNVSVLVRGTTTGTVTKSDGTYSLAVPANAKALIFSSVDMSPVESAIGTQTVINATLKGEDKTMQEVVVTGYGGTQRKKEVTGNISTVKGAAIANTPIQSFDQALGGRATGVQISIPNGVLNNPPVFRIRGTNSLSLSSYPLIIVDGVPSFTGDASGTNAAGNVLASINPNDIESIDIAKDAAATAIYGSRAANGVVFITTKKGRAGKPKLSYNGSVSWTTAYGIPEVLNAQQYTDYKNAALANNPSVNPTFKFNLATDASGKTIDTRWADYIYRQGFSHNNALSVSGGNDNTTYYFSAGFSHQEGIIKTNALNRSNILFNVNSKLNNILTVGGKISYSNEQNMIASASGSLPGEAFGTAGLGRIVMVTAPNVAPYKNDGSYNIIPQNIIGPMNNVLSTTPAASQVGFYNPVVLLDKNRSNSESNHSQATVYIQVNPVKWLTLKTLYGIDYLLVDNEVFQTPIHGDGFASSGNASSTMGKNKRYIWDNTAQFDYSIGGKHNISALIGSEQDRRTSIGFGENRQQISDPVYTVIQAGWGLNNTAGNAFGENYLLSSFGRLNYDYKKKYFISGNLRQDEYSAFAAKKEIFWGASGGWEIAKEKFWQSSHIDHIFSSFKVRGSYGKVGNTGGIGDYATFSTFGSGLYGGLPTLIFNQAGNPTLQWETSSKIDVGASFGLFKDKILIDITRYYNDIKDLILNVPQAPSAGLPTTVPQNVGTMYNKGFELSITATPFRTKDFNWTSTLNFSTNKNEVTSLAPGLTEVLTSTSSLETVSRTAVGYPVGMIWVVPSGGVDPATGRRILINSQGKPVYFQFYVPAGQFMYSNADGTKYLSPKGSQSITQAEDGVMFANTNPKQFGGWENSFSYKGFDLNIMLTYQFGFSVYYGSNAGLHDQRFWNNAVDVLTAWKKPGEVTTVPKPVYNDNVSNGSGLPMSYNVFKGDFVKLKNVSLAYNVPQSIVSRAKLNSVRIYIQGQNLHIFTDYPGPDPEVSSNGNSNSGQGIDRNTIANGRTIVFGLNIGL